LSIASHSTWKPARRVSSAKIVRIVLPFPFKERVGMRQVSKDLARVRAQVALVLSQIQGVFRCPSDTCGLREQSLVSGFYDGEAGAFMEGSCVRCPIGRHSEGPKSGSASRRAPIR
jgi:hypothetical protein